MARASAEGAREDSSAHGWRESRVSTSFLCLLFCSGPCGWEGASRSGSTLLEAVSTLQAVEGTHGINHPKVTGLRSEAAALIWSLPSDLFAGVSGAASQIDVRFGLTRNEATWAHGKRPHLFQKLPADSGAFPGEADPGATEVGPWSPRREVRAFWTPICRWPRPRGAFEPPVPRGVWTPDAA